MDKLKDIFKKIQLSINSALTPEEKKALKENIVQLNEQVAAPTAPTVQLAEMKTKDGKVLTIDGELKEGATVMLVDPTNGPLPAPDGDHELEDGTIITVAGGLVTMVKPVSAPEPAAEMAQVVQQMEAKFSAQTKEIEKSYSVKLAEQKKDFEDKLKDLSNKVLLTSQLLEKIIETPIDTIEFEKSGSVKFEKELSESEYNALSNNEKRIYNREFKR